MASGFFEPERLAFSQHFQGSVTVFAGTCAASRSGMSGYLPLYRLAPDPVALRAGHTRSRCARTRVHHSTQADERVKGRCGPAMWRASARHRGIRAKPFDMASSRGEK